MNIFRALVLAVALIPAVASAKPKLSRLWVQELCSAIDNQTMEMAPYHDLIAYTYQTSLFRIAGVEVSDSAETANHKIRVFIQTNQPQLFCNQVNFNPRNGNILKLAIARKSQPFIDDALVSWQIDLNFVDPVDGFTALDYIEQRRKEAHPDSSLWRVLTNYYNRFRKAGAKHRRELSSP